MFSKNSADLFKSILAPSASTTTQHEEGFYVFTCFRLLHRDFPSGAYLTSREIPGFLGVLVDSHLCWGAEDNSEIPDCPGQQLGEGDWQWGLCSPETTKRRKGSLLLKNKTGRTRLATLIRSPVPSSTRGKAAVFFCSFSDCRLWHWDWSRLPTALVPGSLGCFSREPSLYREHQCLSTAYSYQLQASLCLYYAVTPVRLQYSHTSDQDGWQPVGSFQHRKLCATFQVSHCTHRIAVHLYFGSHPRHTANSKIYRCTKDGLLDPSEVRAKPACSQHPSQNLSLHLSC